MVKNRTSEVKNIMSNRLTINKIDMSPRTFYCLMRHGIKDLHELSNYTRQDINNIPNVGYKTYEDILHICEKYNIKLKE